MAPLICESTIQRSPMSVDSTRGALSLNCAGQSRTQRSFGGLTCESAETMRSLIGEFLLRIEFTDRVRCSQARNVKWHWRSGNPEDFNAETQRRGATQSDSASLGVSAPLR